MHKLLIVAAAAGALYAGPAVAQTGPGGRFMSMYADADANHDGNVTRAEFDAARGARFSQLDTDHNGVLSASERPRWGGGPSRPATPGSPHHMQADANGDGSVTRAEYDAETTRMFQHADANGDGVITHAELQAMLQRMQQHMPH